MGAAVPGVVELQHLFERFAALTATAIQAVDAGDDTALGAALEAREQLAPRTKLRSRTLGDARRAARSKATRDLLEHALRPVRVAAGEAERLNGELTRKAQAARLSIGEQLDRLRHDESARHAYTTVASGAGRAHLDRTR